ASGTLRTGRDDQGRMTFPSLVGYHSAHNKLVAGRAALTLPGSDLTLPLASVKRYMGLDRKFPLGPLSLTPPEASACILRYLRDVLAATLGDPRYRLDSAII